MPLSKHYKGAGSRVSREMKSRYGSDWKAYFYGTEKKLSRRKNPEGEPEEICKDLDNEELALLADFYSNVLLEKLLEQGETEAAELVEESNESLAEAIEILQEETQEDEEDSSDEWEDEE